MVTLSLLAKAPLWAQSSGQASIDDLILRRLVPMFRMGLYHDPPKKGAGPVSTPENRALAAQLLTEGTVLLRN